MISFIYYGRGARLRLQNSWRKLEFFGEVAQPAELPEQHLVSAHHLLSPALKMVSDFTLELCSGPDIAEHAEAAALLLILCQLANAEPPPVP